MNFNSAMFVASFTIFEVLIYCFFNLNYIVFVLTIPYQEECKIEPLFTRKEWPAFCLNNLKQKLRLEEAPQVPWFHLWLERTKKMAKDVLEIILCQTICTRTWGQRFQHNQTLRRRRQWIGETGKWSSGSSHRMQHHSTRRRRDTSRQQALANGACLYKITKKLWTSYHQFF